MYVLQRKAPWKAPTCSRCLCLDMARADKHTEYKSENGILLPKPTHTGDFHTRESPAIQTYDEALI